jgi:DNA repair exonuclease SbcCD ATPase subunit
LPAADKSKFSLAPHPLEQEGSKRKLEPSAAWKADAVKKKKELLRASRKPDIIKALDDAEAKELVEKVGAEVDEEFIHDWRNWLAGIGKRSDYVKAGVPLSSVGQAKPLSRDPQVIGFIDKLTGRVIDYYSEIANMKMRGPAVGRNGGPAKLSDLWLYFKYVVRGEPINPEDFVFAKESKKEDSDLVGNQQGITDEPYEARSLADNKKSIYPDDPQEKERRAATADRQVKRKEAPPDEEEMADDAAEEEVEEKEKAKKEKEREEKEKAAKEKAERKAAKEKAAKEREKEAAERERLLKKKFEASQNAMNLEAAKNKEAQRKAEEDKQRELEENKRAYEAEKKRLQDQEKLTGKSNGEALSKLKEAHATDIQNLKNEADRLHMGIVNAKDKEIAESQAREKAAKERADFLEHDAKLYKEQLERDARAAIEKLRTEATAAIQRAEQEKEAHRSKTEEVLGVHHQTAAEKDAAKAALQRKDADYQRLHTMAYGREKELEGSVAERDSVIAKLGQQVMALQEQFKKSTGEKDDRNTAIQSLAQQVTERDEKYKTLYGMAHNREKELEGRLADRDTAIQSLAQQVAALQEQLRRPQAPTPEQEMPTAAAKRGRQDEKPRGKEEKKAKKDINKSGLQQRLRGYQMDLSKEKFYDSPHQQTDIARLLHSKKRGEHLEGLGVPKERHAEVVQRLLKQHPAFDFDEDPSMSASVVAESLGSDYASGIHKVAQEMRSKGTTHPTQAVLKKAQSDIGKQLRADRRLSKLPDASIDKLANSLMKAYFEDVIKGKSVNKDSLKESTKKIKKAMIDRMVREMGHASAGLI